MTDIHPIECHRCNTDAKIGFDPISKKFGIWCDGCAEILEFATLSDLGFEISIRATKINTRRKLTLAQQLKGVRAALKSKKTPPQLRPGLKLRAEDLAAKIRAEKIQ